VLEEEKMGGVRDDDIMEFFGNDPLCCVPDFLVEDAKTFVCIKNNCS
jgi:hypothetical protein